MDDGLAKQVRTCDSVGAVHGLHQPCISPAGLWRAADGRTFESSPGPVTWTSCPRLRAENVPALVPVVVMTPAGSLHGFHSAPRLPRVTTAAAPAPDLDHHVPAKLPQSDVPWARGRPDDPHRPLQRPQHSGEHAGQYNNRLRTDLPAATGPCRRGLEGISPGAGRRVDAAHHSVTSAGLPVLSRQHPDSRWPQTLPRCQSQGAGGTCIVLPETGPYMPSRRGGWG